MAIEGPLRELGIHEVFQLLDVGRKTGVLKVTSDLRHNDGAVSFDTGAIVAAEIRNNPHQLGTMLVNSGKITADDLRRALERQARETGTRLGQVLVTMGSLSARELEEHVKFQIEEVVFEMMGWREGYFSFAEGPLVAGDASVRIPLSALLMEGARRIDEWSRMERQIPHLGIVPVLAPVASGSQGDIDLEPPEWELLAMIDGERDIRMIAQALGRSDFDVAKTVFGLSAAGVLVLLDQRVSPKRTSGDSKGSGALERAQAALAARDVEGARAAAEAAAALNPGDPQAQLVLGRVRLLAGHPREAESYLRRALSLDPLLAGAIRALGDALALQGRHAEAIDWWRRWLTLVEADRTTVARDQVQEAIRAAQTLESLLRMPHG